MSRKDYWLINLVEKTSENLSEVLNKLEKNEWGEGKHYLKLAISRVNSILEYIGKSAK